MSSYEPISCPVSTSNTIMDSIPIPESLHGPLLKVGTSTLAHPIEFAKVLIQIGHEPIAPKHTKTLLGRPALSLPSVFGYIGHIRRRDGVLGLYRGWPTKIISIGISTVVSEKIKKALENKNFFVKDPAILGRDEDDMTPEEKLSKTMDDGMKEIAEKLACIILTQPLHVCTVRAMAQFVGNESKYDGVFGNIAAVYQENGILGKTFVSVCKPKRGRYPLVNKISPLPDNLGYRQMDILKYFRIFQGFGQDLYLEH